MVSPLPFFLESWKIKKLSYLVKVEGKGFSKSSTRSKSLHGARSSSPNNPNRTFFQKKVLLLIGTGNPALSVANFATVVLGITALECKQMVLT